MSPWPIMLSHEFYQNNYNDNGYWFYIYLDGGIQKAILIYIHALGGVGIKVATMLSEFATSMQIE